MTIDIKSLIEEIRPLLPLQNPLSSFIHNNILMNFEKHTFDEGLKIGQKLYGANLYKDEFYYLDEYHKGRITEENLNEEIYNYINKNGFSTGLFNVIKCLMIKPISNRSEHYIKKKLNIDSLEFLTLSNKEFLLPQIYAKNKIALIEIVAKNKLQYFEEIIQEFHLTSIYKALLDNSDLNDIRIQKNPDELRAIGLFFQWCMCLKIADNFKKQCLKKEPTISFRSKTFWLQQFDEDIDLLIHPLLIRMASVFLDQGMSYWPSPYKQSGVWEQFCDYVLMTEDKIEPHLHDLYSVVKYYQNKTCEEIIQEELALTKLGPEKWKDYVVECLFDLRGWSGMFNKLEKDKDVAPVKAPNAKLCEWIAIRLIMERVANQYLQNKFQATPVIEELICVELDHYQSAYILYQFILKFGLGLKETMSLNTNEAWSFVMSWMTLNDETKTRIWHTAFENSFYQKALSTLNTHFHEPTKPISNPRAQIFFCIDDREESIRRHLEETTSDLETFGAVGFWGLDMNFMSVHHPSKLPHCPPVVKPITTIKEVANKVELEKYKKLNSVENLIAKIFLGFYYHSRTLIRGQLVSFFMGIFTLIPLGFRIYHPKLAKILRHKLMNILVPEIKTDLILDKETNSNSSECYGYTKEEMVIRVESILKMSGVLTHFSKLIVMLSHGSTSNNNPYRQAYGCGACSGRAGHPNARAYTLMANDPEVRQILKTRGISIPDDTYFVGGFHDTCNDDIYFLDEELVPASHLETLKYVKEKLLYAAELNAFERARRFAGVFPLKSTKEALEHVRARSESIAEPRPEYGHNNVSLAIFGRRDLTKGLFLDRRSFLISYDPTIDDESGKILIDVLAGALPVCANINLDYFFSNVDNEKYGCGSKLPLNVTSLLGVMTGSSSDLRIGLARQMVELHEPVRIMALVETKEEVMNAIFSRSVKLKNLVHNFWLRFGIIDPDSKQIKIYTEKGFVDFDVKATDIPSASSSIAWVKNKPNSLEFAQIKLG